MVVEGIECDKVEKTWNLDFLKNSNNNDNDNDILYT